MLRVFLTSYARARDPYTLTGSGLCDFCVGVWVSLFFPRGNFVSIFRLCENGNKKKIFFVFFTFFCLREESLVT